MKKQQYDALVSLQKETIAKAQEIYSDATVYVDFNIHQVATDAEIWKFEKPIIRKSGIHKILVNASFSKINLYSKEF